MGRRMMDEINMFDSFDPPKEATDWKWSYSDYPKEKNGIKVFSCFACGGGSTMGYKLAGCDVIGCVEIDPKMNAVYVKNHHPKYNFCMDLRDFNALPDDQIPEELFGIDILGGSPPCTTFSIRNAQTFPRDYDFGSNVRGVWTYICGMSVPPVMMKRVVTKLIEQGVFDYKKGN